MSTRHKNIYIYIFSYCGCVKYVKLEVRGFLGWNWASPHTILAHSPFVVSSEWMRFFLQKHHNNNNALICFGIVCNTQFMGVGNDASSVMHFSSTFNVLLYQMLTRYGINFVNVCNQQKSTTCGLSIAQRQVLVRLTLHKAWSIGISCVIWLWWN